MKKILIVCIALFLCCYVKAQNISDTTENIKQRTKITVEDNVTIDYYFEENYLNPIIVYSNNTNYTYDMNIWFYDFCNNKSGRYFEKTLMPNFGFYFIFPCAGIISINARIRSAEVLRVWDEYREELLYQVNNSVSAISVDKVKKEGYFRIYNAGKHDVYFNIIQIRTMESECYKHNTTYDKKTVFLKAGEYLNSEYSFCGVKDASIRITPIRNKISKPRIYINEEV